MAKSSKLATWVPLAIVVGVGAVIMGPQVMNYFQARQIRAHGVATTATVKAIHDTGTRVNDNPEVDLTLEVQRPGAQPYTATVETVVSVVNLPSLQPGKVVKVKYDPKHPAKVALDL